MDESAKLGATEIWTIENVVGMDHPFHLHGFQFQLLDRNGIPEMTVMEGHRERAETLNRRDSLCTSTRIRDTGCFTVTSSITKTMA